MTLCKVYAHSEVGTNGKKSDVTKRLEKSSERSGAWWHEQQAASMKDLRVNKWNLDYL